MSEGMEPSLPELFEEFIYLYEDRYCWALSRIADLEEDLEEAQDTIRRLIAGDAVEWRDN